MTITEFKAWLDGFTDAMEGPPNAEQWGKIKSKIEALEVFPFANLGNLPGHQYRSGDTPIMTSAPHLLSYTTC
jgi:hypothetical protein